MNQEQQERIEAAVREILSAIGENPDRPGLEETPARVARMYEEVLATKEGTDFEEYKMFDIDPTDQPQLVTMNNIKFYSMCEHHMLPFFGSVHVGYLPADGQIIGLSKIPRLVDFASKKLTVQEKMTREIAETLTDVTNPSGVAVAIEARHMCIEMRGIRKPEGTTQTTFYTGAFRNDLQLRNEFLDTIRRG